MTPPPWSFSSLTSFETCPKRYYLTRVAKKIKEPETEATIWGKRVHKALEERVRDGKELPVTIAGYEKLASKIAASKGKVYVEQQLAMTDSFKPTGWWDKDAWCRAVLDVSVIGTTSALILDWKTGKRKTDSDQLKMSAGMAFAHYPEVEKVNTGFVWLKDNLIDKEEFTRTQIGEIWGSFLPRVERLNLAYEKDRWPARPSGLCAKWCPVGKRNCDFCGK